MGFSGSILRTFYSIFLGIIFFPFFYHQCASNPRVSWSQVQFEKLANIGLDPQSQVLQFVGKLFFFRKTSWCVFDQKCANQVLTRRLSTSKNQHKKRIVNKSSKICRHKSVLRRFHVYSLLTRYYCTTINSGTNITKTPKLAKRAHAGILQKPCSLQFWMKNSNWSWI